MRFHNISLGFILFDYLYLLWLFILLRRFFILYWRYRFLLLLFFNRLEFVLVTLYSIVSLKSLTRKIIVSQRTLAIWAMLSHNFNWIFVYNWRKGELGFCLVVRLPEFFFCLLSCLRLWLIFISNRLGYMFRFCQFFKVWFPTCRGFWFFFHTIRIFLKKFSSFFLLLVSKNLIIIFGIEFMKIKFFVTFVDKILFNFLFFLK